jgi:hypothetical protein
MERPHERSIGRWNNKMDLNKIGCDNVEWVHLAQDRDYRSAVVNTVLNFRVQQMAGNFLTT